jgi:hypothetical protein
VAATGGIGTGTGTGTGRGTGATGRTGSGRGTCCDKFLVELVVQRLALGMQRLRGR